MQNRDYDDYIFVASLNGFRSFNFRTKNINLSQETNCYCNMYANKVSVSALHSMNQSQINAIHYFEDHEAEIFKTILEHLKGIYKMPKEELGLFYINILNKSKENTCLAEYVFFNAKAEEIKVVLHKNLLF